MIPRYNVAGTMIQDLNGTYVAVSDCEKLRTELGNFVIEKYKAFERGDMTAEEALKTAAVFVKLKLSQSIR